MSNKQIITKILSIDASVEDAGVLEKYLKDIGFKFEFYHSFNFSAATELISKHSFDLILLDFNLPDVSGFKAITTLTELVQNVPIIIVTTTNNEIIINQSVKTGVQDFLLKWHFDAKTLCRVAKFSIHRFQLHKRLLESSKEYEQYKKRSVEFQKMAQFGTWEMDVVTNEMTWSEGVFQIFNLQHGSFNPTLSEYMNYVSVDDRVGVSSFFEEAGKDGLQHKIEHKIVLNGTQVKHVSLQAMIKIEESGRRVMLVGSTQDVTERKVAERLLLEKAISSQTASIQEEVLTDLGFQVRTPLSSIVNLLYLLGNSETSNQQELLITDLKTSVNDLSISVNNLLNFSLMVTENVKDESEDIVLAEFLKGAENVVKIKGDSARMSVKFFLDKKLPEKIIADPRKLTQIVFNLIEHLLRLGGEGEEIIVTTTCHSVQPDLLMLEFNIKNSHKRFNVNELKEMSNAEAIIKEAFSGDDKMIASKKRLMGVAIATKLINALQGNLEIRNYDELGSEFRVKIPVRPAKQVMFQAGIAPVSPMKILLVEDHFLNQLATKKVLHAWSEFVSVEIAVNGQLGYEAAQEGDFDLVLMDIQMPVMNGLEAAKKIREFSQVPIIALTANSTKQEQEKCIDVGMNDYLSKPFKPNELYDRIMAVMATTMA